eukprot:365712-Chlamydomonas_euryale.AAC.11
MSAWPRHRAQLARMWMAQRRALLSTSVMQRSECICTFKNQSGRLYYSHAPGPSTHNCTSASSLAQVTMYHNPIATLQPDTMDLDVSRRFKLATFFGCMWKP